MRSAVALRKELGPLGPLENHVLGSCLLSGKEKAHKHKRIWRDWVGVIFLFFVVMPYGGEKTHKQPPPQITRQSREYSVGVSQPQSITQKGVHTSQLTAREREHCFLSILAMSSCGFSGVNSANTLVCDTLALSHSVFSSSFGFSSLPS